MRFFLVFIIGVNFCFSQEKVMVPVNGTITFIKEDSIYNKDLVIQSFKKLFPEMKEQLKKEVYNERLSFGIETDTILLDKLAENSLKNFELFFPLILEDRDDRTVNFIFNDYEISKYYEVNNTITSSVTINILTNTTTDENNEIVDIFENKIIEIKEYRSEKKTINNYPCFKVIYLFETVNNNDVYIDKLLKPNTREMWVTENIKFNHHPIINESEILNKYYPLEIIESNSKINGIVTTYKIKNLDLKSK